MADLLPKGYYVAHVQKWGLAEAKTGTVQFFLQFTLAHKKGPGGTKEPCDPVQRTWFRGITEKTIEYFVKDLEAFGYDRQNFDDLDPSSPNAFDFEGKEIEVQCKHETYEGKEREKWELALVKQMNVKPVEAGGVALLNALFGSNLAGMKSPAKKPMPTAPVANVGANGEDIPF